MDGAAQHPASGEDARRFTLDGQPIVLAEFLKVNDEALSDQQLAEIQLLQPGQEFLLGGGAGAEFVLRREA